MTKKVKRKEKHGELIFGIHPIVELLRAKRRSLLMLYTTKPVPKGWHVIEALLSQKRIVPIQYVSREVLHRLAGTTDHQSVVGFAQPFIFRKKFFDSTKQKFLVLLDGIQDVRNLGAILRSAYCTGVEGVIICKKNAAPLNAVALKSSAGLAEHLEIYNAPSVTAAVQELQKAHYTLYITTFSGENAATCSYREPLCVVIGSEATGVSKNILSAGTQITLPQRTTDISYNASVAAGIVLFLIATHTKKI